MLPGHNVLSLFILTVHLANMSGLTNLSHSMCSLPYFRDQMPPWISSRPQIIAAPPEVLNEIVAALE